jgi:hypothetical protein
MIPSSSFREEDLVLSQLFLVRERDTVYTLQRLVVGVAEEIRSRVLDYNEIDGSREVGNKHDFGDHERLDFSRMRDVRPDT